MSNIVIDKMPGTSDKIIIYQPNITGSGTIELGHKTVTLETKDMYVPENIDVIVRAQATLKQGSLSNAGTSGVTYTENTAAATVIPAEGSLYINEGWYPATRISLGHLIPDDAKYTNAGVAEIRSGFEAYDTTGKKLIGTIPDVVPYATGGELEEGVITVPNKTINVTPNVAFYSGTGTASKTSTTTITNSTYGIIGESSIASTKTYIRIDPGASGGSVTNTASITVNRKAIDVQSETGYTNGACTDIDAASQDYSGSGTTSTSVAAGTNYYMPVVSTNLGGGTVTTSFSTSSKTNPTITLSTSAGIQNPGTSETIATYGLTKTQPTGTSVKYLKIIPEYSVNGGGSVTITPKYTKTATTYSNDAGAITSHNNTVGIAAVTSATNNGGEDTVSFTLTPTETNWDTYYIPVVNPTGTGGAVTKTSGSGSVSGTKPNVAISNGGSISNAATANSPAHERYGFISGTPTTGTDGVDYLMITTTGTIGTAQTWSGTASIQTTRAKVTADNTYKGAVSMTTSTLLLDKNTNAGTVEHEISGSVASTINNASSNYSKTFYAPIVHPTTKGGDVTQVTSGTSAIASVVTKPNVTVSSEGTFTESTSSTYGITTNKPSGSDGRDYLTITSKGTPDAGKSIKGTATIAYNRANIQSNGTFKGIVYLGDGDEVQTSKTGTLSTDISGSVEATSSGTPTYYIPTTNVLPGTGAGAVTSGYSTTTTTGAAASTSTKAYINTNTTEANQTALSEYGIIATTDTTGIADTITFINSASTTNGVIKITPKAKRSSVTYNVAAGAIKASTGAVLFDATDFTNGTPGNETVAVTLTNNLHNYHISFGSVSSTIKSIAITKPKVGSTLSTAADSSDTTNSIAAVTYTTASDAKTAAGLNGKYVKIATNTSVTNGSATATPQVTTTAGVITAATNTEGTSGGTTAIQVTAGDKAVKYMAVYGGAYTVS